jgi:hypothetical protein
MAALAATLLTVSAASAGPGYHQPRAGSCHRLTLHDFLSPSAPTAAVGCSKRHTSRTLVVKRYAAPVDWDAERLFADLFVPCARTANRALGGDRSRAMSAYEISMFVPSATERAHGARWKRCDLVLVGGRKLQPIPRALKLRSAPLPDRYARCLAGPEKHLVVTVCSKKHGYRVTGAVKVNGKKYPGADRLARTALHACPKLVTSKHWRYQTFAHVNYWRAGWRSVVCYSRTTQ